MDTLPSVGSLRHWMTSAVGMSVAPRAALTRPMTSDIWVVVNHPPEERFPRLGAAGRVPCPPGRPFHSHVKGESMVSKSLGMMQNDALTDDIVNGVGMMQERCTEHWWYYSQRRRAQRLPSSIYSLSSLQEWSCCLEIIGRRSWTSPPKLSDKDNYSKIWTNQLHTPRTGGTVLVKAS
jgi:hypothetical protein